MKNFSAILVLVSMAFGLTLAFAGHISGNSIKGLNSGDPANLDAQPALSDPRPVLDEKKGDAIQILSIMTVSDLDALDGALQVVIHSPLGVLKPYGNLSKLGLFNKEVRLFSQSGQSDKNRDALVDADRIIGEIAQTYHISDRALKHITDIRITHISDEVSSDERPSPYRREKK